MIFIIWQFFEPLCVYTKYSKLSVSSGASNTPDCKSGSYNCNNKISIALMYLYTFINKCMVAIGRGYDQQECL